MEVLLVALLVAGCCGPPLLLLVLGSRGRARSGTDVYDGQNAGVGRRESDGR